MNIINQPVLSLILLSLFLSSCEKTIDSDGDDTGLNDGNLTITVSQLEQTPFSDIARKGVTDACTHLNYAVYDLAGSRVKLINQQLGDKNFGTVSLQLTENDYRVVVVAHSSNGNPTMTDPAKISFTNTMGFTDTFLYSQILKVGEKPQTQSISLSRSVALCRFTINDSYPQEVIRMRFKYKGGSAAFNAYTGLGCTNSTQTVTFDVASGKNQFDLYTFLTDKQGVLELTVDALDATDSVVCERDFRFPIIQNKITWLSGNFFGEVDSEFSKVDIDIITDWDGEIRIPF